MPKKSTKTIRELFLKEKEEKEKDGKSPSLGLATLNGDFVGISLNDIQEHEDKLTTTIKIVNGDLEVGKDKPFIDYPFEVFDHRVNINSEFPIDFNLKAYTLDNIFSRLFKAASEYHKAKLKMSA